MNRITCEFPSECLKSTAKVNVLLPKRRPSPFHMGTDLVSGPFPTVTLLHGAFEDAETWLVHSTVANLVDELGVAVVLPYGANSFWLDDPQGERYLTYVTQELPDYLQQILPLAAGREMNSIGGFSMGGYGAVHAALTAPDRYHAVFSLSGALDVRNTSSFVRACGGILPPAMRDRKVLAGGENDLFTLLERADAKALPDMLFACGNGDVFLRSTEGFADCAKRIGAQYEVHIAPGAHDWSYWSRQLPACMNWCLTGEYHD